MGLRQYALDDKYRAESGSAYMSGIQALVRLPIEQMLRDRRRGLNTGCFISGYPGSPLGGYDSALLQAQKHLEPRNIHFSPGVNEDLALTAVMGSQLFQKLPHPTVDGAVGIWFGKGPGVDRSGDALRHASFAGTGKNCGALALAGDDHVSKSSTIPHQSELSFYNCSVPVLSPANTQEALDYGLYGIEMSRFSGAWTGLKLATDLCDGGGIVEFSPERCPVAVPELLIDGEPYEKTTATMLVVPYSLGLEADVHHRRLEAARHFARSNGLNRITAKHEDDRLGIVACGKSYADLMSALRALRLGDEDLAREGIRILKMGMVFPLEPRIIDEFIDGLETVLVVEEKRSFLEFQLRELLFNRAVRPAVYGKTDAAGGPLLPSTGELDADMIALVLGRFIRRTPGVENAIEKIAAAGEKFAKDPRVRGARAPSYCSGCPHNRSTLLLEGQIAGGGIGCHGMAGLMREVDRGIEYIFQMGGEGAAWIGSAPFSGKKHIFQNLGDGTYFHSGRMAIQAAVDAGVNITYKLLYNDAVAMTGGQTAAGGLPIPAVTRELEAQGIEKIVLLSDDTEKYGDRSMLARSVEVRERDELEDVLAELEQVEGVSVMIYDQMCAAEKRRRRNRGVLPKPVRRMVINERVCEGCGDCVKHANCVSLLPVENRLRPEDAHSPVFLQYRLHVRLGRLPFVRLGDDRRGFRPQTAAAASAAGGGDARARGESRGRRRLSHLDARRRRRRRRHGQRDAGDGRIARRTTGDHAGSNRSRAKRRRGGRAPDDQRPSDRIFAAHQRSLARSLAGLRPGGSGVCAKFEMLLPRAHCRRRQFQGDSDWRSHPQGTDRALGRRRLRPLDLPQYPR